MSLLRRVSSVSLVPTKLSKWMTYCSAAHNYYLTSRVVTAEKGKANCKRTEKQCTRQLWEQVHACTNIAAGIDTALKIGTQTALTIFMSAPVLYGLCVLWYKNSDMNKKVMRRFENPVLAPLIREGYHFPRDEENEIRKAFLNQTDTLGLVGVVFGPAGTGKSNLVRTVCNDAGRGVIYMEIGSHRQFPYHLAKACGVPIEPNWIDTLVAKLFLALKTHITLPESKDEDALALVLPVIANGGKVYKDEYSRVPVLFIDGIDILAKRDEKLYLNLVDWAKKCANEDSLRIVFVCSDSHILTLDQQSFKSRLDDLIEIDDIDETEALELMKDKYGFSDSLARSIYDIIGGRLADIHKVVAIWRKNIAKLVDVPRVVVPQKVVVAVKNIHLEQLLRSAISDTLNGVIRNPNEDKFGDINNVQRRKLVSNILTARNCGHGTSNTCHNTCIAVPVPQEVVDVVNDIQLERELQTVILDTLERPIPDSSDDNSEDRSGTILDISRRELICDIIRTNHFRNSWKAFNKVTVQVIPQGVINAIKAITPAPQELQAIVSDTLKSKRIQNPNEDKSEDIKDMAMKERTRDIIRAIIPQEVVTAVNDALKKCKEASSLAHINMTKLQIIVLDSLKTIENPYEDKSEDIKDSRIREHVRNILIRRRPKGKVVVPQEVVAGVNATKDLQTVVLDALKKKIIKTKKEPLTPLQKNDQGQKPEDQTQADTQKKDPLVALEERIRDIIGTYNFSEKIKEQFKREMRQALYNALADEDKRQIKKVVVQSILQHMSNRDITVEEVALKCSKGDSQLQEVKDAIQELLRHNVLRITKRRTLLPYSKMALKVLQEYIDNDANL